MTYQKDDEEIYKELEQLKSDLDELVAVRGTLEQKIEDQAEEIKELEDKILNAKEQFDSIGGLCTDMLRSLR